MTGDIEDTLNHIAIVEDDEELRSLLASYFQQRGYRVSQFASAHGVIDWVKQQVLAPLTDLHVIICDIELPDGNGLELLNKFHGFEGLGKILISVRVKESDRIIGLKTGADDYLCKPVNPEELFLRTQNLIKKLNLAQNTLPAQDYLRFGKSLLHPETRLLIQGSRKTLLTDGEHLILLSLIGKQGKVVSREELATSLGKKAMSVSSRSIDVLVARLRKKLEDNARSPERIITKRGKGYVLVCSD